MGDVPKGEDAPCDGADWRLRGPVGLKTPTRLQHRGGLGHMMNIQSGFTLWSLIGIYV